VRRVPEFRRADPREQQERQGRQTRLRLLQLPRSSSVKASSRGAILVGKKPIGIEGLSINSDSRVLVRVRGQACSESLGTFRTVEVNAAKSQCRVTVTTHSRATGAT